MMDIEIKKLSDGSYMGWKKWYRGIMSIGATIEDLKENINNAEKAYLEFVTKQN